MPARRRTVLSVLALTPLLASALPVAPTAHAATPTRIDADYWGVDCAFDLPSGGTIFLYASGDLATGEVGIGGFVESEDGFFEGNGTDTSFDPGFDPGFAGSLDLFDTDGGFAGTATIAAGVSPGEPVTTVVRERSGNSWTRGTMTETEVTVTPTQVTYAGQQVDVESGGCSGALTSFDVRTTNPAGTVYRSRDLASAICELEGFEDARVQLSGRYPDAFAELVADHGDSVETAQGDLDFAGRRAHLDTTLREIFSETDVAGLSMHVTLTRTGALSRQTEGGEGIVERVTVAPYDARITVGTTDGRSGSTTCPAYVITDWVKVAPHN